MQMEHFCLEQKKESVMDSESGEDEDPELI